MTTIRLEFTAHQLILNAFSNGQTNKQSTLYANLSGILSRGDMPHFQRMILSLDFTGLLNLI
jgi:hypothetical protein